MKDRDWILEDLAKSGLAPEDLEIIPLVSEEQLDKYLGLRSTGGQSIIDVGGYFIENGWKVANG